MTLLDVDTGEILDETDDPDDSTSQTTTSGTQLLPGQARPHRGTRRLSPQNRRRPVPPARNLYPNVYVWVVDWFSTIYARHLATSHLVWCARWYEHPEAVARLESAWKAWEALRTDPGTGASVWFRDHGDPCWTILSDLDGPFSRCQKGEHRLPLALLSDSLPGWVLRS